MSSSLDRLFVCTRCKKPVTVKVIKGTTKLIVIGKCPNRHGKRFTLSLSDLNDWAPILDSHFFKCIRCNTPITFKTLLKGPWAKVVITCPTHGKNDTRILPKVVYTALSTGKKEDKYEPPSPTTPSIPTCQYCGESTQVSYISQYSRYFCYKCERYIEDQKVVEKVRSTPEMDELKIKIKNLAEKIDKNLPHAICELPAALNMPHIDSSRIESILLDMILKGELNGELDPATEEITFLDAPIVSTAVSTPTDKTTTPQVCTRCGSELQYVEAKSAYFCKKCFEYTARTPTAKPSAIEAVRDFDYVGGQVRFKVAIRNKSKLVITNIGVELDIPAEFLLVRILPEASLDDIDRGLSKIDKLMPNSSQGIDYYLEPVACGTGVISGIAKFQDAEGNYNSTPVKSREIAIKCPLIFTPEEANIAMLRNLMNSLTKDYRRWALPSSPPDTYTMLHDVVNQYEISHIQAFQISGDPYQLESWYYTRTKTTNHPIAIRINVSEQNNTLDLTIGCEDMAELTGLLAKISEDFQNKIRDKFQQEPKPAFGNLKDLLCECGSPLAKLPSISENVTCNSCQKSYTWKMLGY